MKKQNRQFSFHQLRTPIQCTCIWFLMIVCSVASYIQRAMADLRAPDSSKMPKCLRPTFPLDNLSTEDDQSNRRWKPVQHSLTSVYTVDSRACITNCVTLAATKSTSMIDIGLHVHEQGDLGEYNLFASVYRAIEINIDVAVTIIFDEYQTRRSRSCMTSSLMCDSWRSTVGSRWLRGRERFVQYQHTLVCGVCWRFLWYPPFLFRSPESTSHDDCQRELNETTRS